MDDLTEEELYSVVTALVSMITDSTDPVIQHTLTLTRSAYYAELESQFLPTFLQHLQYQNML